MTLFSMTLLFFSNQYACHLTLILVDDCDSQSPTSSNNIPSKPEEELGSEKPPSQVDTADIEAQKFRKPMGNSGDYPTENTSGTTTVQDEETTSDFTNDIGKIIKASMTADQIVTALHKLTDEHKLFLVKHHFKPSPLFQFPQSFMNKANRSFQRAWLVYSPICDGGFCLPCAIFAKDRSSKGVLVNTSMRKWVKASNILGSKTGHSSKSHHSDAVSAMNSFFQAMDSPCQTFPVQFDSALKQQFRDNRHILQQIAEAVLFVEDSALLSVAMLKIC